MVDHLLQLPNLLEIEAQQISKHRWAETKLAKVSLKKVYLEDIGSKKD